MRHVYLAAAALSAVIAAPALAQDPTQPFSGLYVAGTIGKIAQGNDKPGEIEFDRNLDGTFGDPVRTAAGADAFSPGFCGGRAVGTTPGQGCTNDKDGFDYSARVGFDKQFGNIVVGALGEFGDNNTKDYQTAFSTTPANYIITRSIDWEASARLRAGYAAPSTLFYAHGGVGYAKVRQRLATSNTANAFSSRGGRDEQVGFIVGGGIEQKLAPNISVGLEYGYHDYKTDDYVVRVAQGTAPASNPFVLAPNTTGTDFRRTDDNFRWHSVKAVAAFRF